MGYHLVNSVGKRYTQYLENFNIIPPNIHPPLLPVLPQWSNIAPKCDHTLTTLNKGITDNSQYIKYFNQIIIKYPAPTWNYIYTDGSKSAGERVGCAFVHNGIKFLYPLLEHTSIFTAELFAIYQSLIYIKESNIPNTIIFTDSLSSLSAIQDPYHSHPICSLISSLLSPMQIVLFCYVPSHVGIKGNELADEAAKEAANIISAPLPLTHMNDVWIIFKLAIGKEWQTAWDSMAHQKLHGIKPIIKSWDTSCRLNRREEVILARLRLGHTFATHEHLMGDNPPPMCQRCATSLSVSHILCDCPLYDNERTSLPLPHTLKNLLGDNPSTVKATLAFIKAIKIKI